MIKMNYSVAKYLEAYLLAINLMTFVIYGYDKMLSKKKKLKLRIPEKTLVFLAVIGGNIGAYAAMKLFRHKTRKPLFYIGIPLITVLYIFLIVIIFFNHQ